MLSSHTRLSEKQPTASWNVCSVSECLFLFWSVWLHPLPIYPIMFWHPRLPDGGKHSILQPQKPVNEGQMSHILQETKKLWHLQYLKNSMTRGTLKRRQINSSTYSVKHVILHCPQSGNPCKQEGGRENSLQYFNFGLQYLFQRSYQYYTLHL